MKKTFTLSNQTIKTNVLNLKKLMTERNLDAFYISSFDPFISEYVPLEDNHRYYITGFTGSMAEVLVPLEGKVRLYVDGRYFEQADLEVDHDVIEVVKVKSDSFTTEELVKDISTFKVGRLGLEADRTTLSYLKKLMNAAGEVVSFKAGDLAQIISFEPLPQLGEVSFIPRKWRGRDTLEKTRAIFSHDKQGMYVTALDSIAWITNCRGYHLPFLSSFYAKALITREKAYIFVTPETPISKEALNEIGLEFIFLPFNQIKSKLDQLQNTLHLEEVWFDPSMMNSADFEMLIKIFGVEKLIEKNNGLYEYQSIKEPIEIKQMEASFQRADQAIAKTVKWVKESVKKQQRITELDLYHETFKRYQAEGAVELSFNTIAGVGANGSIIHYGNPSDQVLISDKDMVLLDSGGYFDGGWATDTTRTFFSGVDGSKAHPKMVEMYTLVLKGLIAVLTAVFPDGTKGMVLDGLARNAMRKKGYDYNHGTGHGVGIHVHEPGVRISPVSTLPMKPGQVVSIEPGIYIPGFGGVRLENIAYTEKHPEFPNMLRLKTLVYVGFDPALIDKKLLTDEEKEYLQSYETECLKRGTSLQLSH